MPGPWQFLVTLNERLRPLRDPVEMQQTAVRLLGEHLDASRVHYTLIDGDEFVIDRSHVDGATPYPTRGRLARFGAAIIDACRRGDTVVIDDVRTDTRLTAEERVDLLDAETAAFVGTPLIKEGQWTGTLAVHSTTPRRWTSDQVALVEITGQVTWAAGERARAEAALGRIQDRQAFLRRLNETIRSLSEPRQILEETCRLLGNHLRVDRVAYGDIEGDDCIVRGEYTNGVPPLPTQFPWRGMAGSRTADILTGETLAVNDAASDAHSPEERAALKAAGIGAYICPLLVKNGRLIGSCGIHSRLPRAWTADEISLAQEVADRVWATIEHRKAEAELQANEDRLAFLLRLSDAIGSSNDPGAVQDIASQMLREHLGVNRVGYAEIDEGEYVIRHEHAAGVRPMEGRGASTFGAALRDAYRRREPVIVNDVQTDPRFTADERVMMEARQIAAFVGVSLIKQGRLLAAFGANNATPRQWAATEVALIRDVAERTWEAVERARAEKALREREHRYRLALDASGGASWTCDVRTNRIDWDEAFRAQFGFPADEPPKFETWLARVHPEDQPRMQAGLQEALYGSDTWDNTYRIVMPDGAVRWIQSRGRADRDAAGTTTQISGLELDITERRRAEQALQARREEEHDRELRLLLETATQGIVSVDANGAIVMANRALETMCGWAPGELIGQSISKLLPFAWREGRLERRTDYLGVRKDGTTFPIEVSVNQVPTVSGGRAIAFVTDITERLRAASALQERSEELEYRTTQLSRMAWELTLAEHHAREQIARTLHDGLQQLLLIVALNIEQAVKQSRDAGAAPGERLLEAKHHLDEAIAAARSLHLDVFPPVLQRSGLPAALTWLANWAHEKYAIEVQIEADPRADSERKDIRTLLFESTRELLFNAFKHAHATRVALTLTLTADDQLCIVVTDEGVGFEPAKLDDRSPDAHVGWGLFSIRERLTLLGGHVDIDSTPAQGTRVRLVAPRGTAKTVEPSPVHGPLRILIVDDHAAIRNALRQVFQQRPQLSVAGDASNGVEAIAQARTLRPDVIIMDVSMPQMDGIEATARIHAELPDIHIVGLSMQHRDPGGHPIEHAGAEAFFVKGVDAQPLIDHLLVVHAARGAAPA